MFFLNASRDKKRTSSITMGIKSLFTSTANTTCVQGSTAETRVSTAPKDVNNTGSVQLKISQIDANIVGGQFWVDRKIGEGSFGSIFMGTNIYTREQVAIKFEPANSRATQLHGECDAYDIMAGTVGVPSVYYFGQEGVYNILCLDLLGPSLEDMFDLCDRRFSVKTVCMLAKQMVTRMKAVHDQGLVYRDIKPDNFLIGRLPRNSELALNEGKMADPYGIVSNHSLDAPHPAAQIFLIDFGLAKMFLDPKTKKHIPFRENRGNMTGTARYASTNAHFGRELSRRDDLESLGHVFMYFLCGSLPWQGIKAATPTQKYEKIGQMKCWVPVDELCHGFPEEFRIYLKYCRDLTFDEKPDYNYLWGLFDQALRRLGEEDDGVFDWMLEMDRLNGKRGKDQPCYENPPTLSDTVLCPVPYTAFNTPTNTSNEKEIFGSEKGELEIDIPDRLDGQRQEKESTPRLFSKWFEKRGQKGEEKRRKKWWQGWFSCTRSEEV
ncbi:hypothetical protein HDU98_012239 [Podochytrium sp. JEL0797]|nr:hypothetical protein HDU98_012239 [Podochytrium sp. JEL0797]